MSSRLFIVPIIFLSLQIAQAQKQDSGLYAGLDVIKTFSAAVERSFTIEPVVTFITPNRTTLNGVVGFSNYQPGEIYNNMDYQSKGFYFKAGVGKFVSKIFESTLMLGYTNFTETGIKTFEGDYYGDFVFKGEQKHELFFLEIQGNFWITLSQKLYLVPDIRIDVMFKAPEGKYFRPYYAPGLGFLDILTPASEGNLQSSFITGGVSAKLIYKLF